jgi:hypothetical protein
MILNKLEGTLERDGRVENFDIEGDEVYISREHVAFELNNQTRGVTNK